MEKLFIGIITVFSVMLATTTFYVMFKIGIEMIKEKEYAKGLVPILLGLIFILSSFMLVTSFFKEL